MTSLIAAVLFFVGIHVLVSGTRLRDVLVARLGARAYLGLFSLASAAALTWMILAFSRARFVTLTGLQDWRWLAAVLVLVAVMLVVLGLATKSPTAAGGESALDDPDPARGILRITRHPFLWGFALWAATHMLFNPQPAALWFFGGFLALSLVGPLLIDAKRARRFGEKWTRYAAVTSNVPFAAIVQGRNRLVLAELGMLKLGIALALFVTLLLLHPRFFGVPAL